MIAHPLVSLANIEGFVPLSEDSLVAVGIFLFFNTIWLKNI